MRSLPLPVLTSSPRHRLFMKYSARRQATNFHHRTDFDRAKTRRWNPFGDADSLVEVSRLNYVITAELLTRLGKGPVGYHRFPFTHSDTGGRRDRMERAGVEVLTAGAEILR